MPAPTIAILGLRSIIPTRLPCKPQRAQGGSSGRPTKAVRSLRPAADGFNVVAVKIEDEGGVVVRMIMGS
jgi:hypothetical protein